MDSMAVPLLPYTGPATIDGVAHPLVLLWAGGVSEWSGALSFRSADAPPDFTADIQYHGRVVIELPDGRAGHAWVSTQLAPTPPGLHPDRTWTLVIQGDGAPPEQCT